MGLFLNVLLIKDSEEAAVKQSLARLSGDYPDWFLVPEACQYQQEKNGLKVLLSDMCAGYEVMTQVLSQALACPVMMCYIYDGDFWGYFFYDKGAEVDSFNPMPDYFEEVSDEERKRLAGKSDVIASYFDVEEARIKNYLQIWPEDVLDSDEALKAYPDDEFMIGEDWQMADFMRALGCPYDWED